MDTTSWRKQTNSMDIEYCNTKISATDLVNTSELDGSGPSNTYKKQMVITRPKDNNMNIKDNNMNINENPINRNDYQRNERNMKNGYIIRRRSNENEIVKTFVSTLDLTQIKPQRAGVIIYTIHNNNIYFGLGLDSKSHDLTDFGGGVSYKKDCNAVRGALREFKEETLSIFENITEENIQNCPVLYDNNNLIIFIHIAINPDEVCAAFKNEYFKVLHNYSNQGKQRKNPEVCGITWLNLNDFQTGIKTEGIIFSRVRRFLWRCGNFYNLL